jgi:hypothetical protein
MCSKSNFSRDFHRFTKNSIIPGQSCPGAKCSHEEKLSRLGECPCLQRRGTRVNSCPGTSKISCEQHYSFIKEPRQFLSRDNCLPRDITLSRVHVKRALERCLYYNLVPRVFPLGTKGPCDLLKSGRFLINYLGSLSSAEVSMSFTWRLPYRTAVWKTRRRRRGKQEAKPLPEVGRKSAKLDEKVLELE